jgi:hypothetical protein
MSEQEVEVVSVEQLPLQERILFTGSDELFNRLNKIATKTEQILNDEEEEDEE